MLTIGLTACGGSGDNLTAPTRPPAGPAVVATVTVSPSTATVTAGSSLPLTAVVRDAAGNTLTGRTVTWTSSTPAVAAVSGTGVVAGAAPGVATIIAMSEGQGGLAAITVRAATVAAVSVTPAAVTLGPGANVTLTAIPRDASNNPLGDCGITWTASDPGVATVLATGVVTAMHEGVATVTAACGGQAGSATITVTGIAVASIEVTPPALTLIVGQVALLQATMHDAAGNVLSGRAVTWTTSNPGVVTGIADSALAVITGVAPGVASITATSEGTSVAVPVTVAPPPAGQDLCATIAGAAVVASDGQYLGRLTNQFDVQSIYNSFGPYGGQFSALSIYNSFGKYGSQFSPLSPFDPFSTTPPRLVKNGTALAYFTVNYFLTPYVPPAFAATCTFP